MTTRAPRYTNRARELLRQREDNEQPRLVAPVAGQLAYELRAAGMRADRANDTALRAAWFAFSNG